MITGKVCCLPQLIMETQSYTRQGGVRRIYVTATSFLFDDMYKYVDLTMRRQQALAWAEADINMWGGPRQVERVMAEARKFLSPAMLMKVRESNRAYLAGAQIGEVQQYARSIDERPQDRSIVVYGSAMNNAYSPEQTLAEYDRLYSAGHNLVCRVFTSSAVQVEQMRRVLPERMLGWMEFYGRMPQKRYWSMASEAHVVISPEIPGGEFGAGIAELLLLGVVPIYQVTPLAKDYVDGYPFVFATRDELRVHLRYLLVEGGWRAESTREWLQKQQAYTLENVSGDNHWPMLEADILPLMNRLDSPKSTLIDLIERATRDADDLTLAQFSKRIATFSDNRKGLENIDEGRYGLSKSLYRKILMLLGWQDLCDEREPHFVRMKDVDPVERLAAVRELGKLPTLDV